MSKLMQDAYARRRALEEGEEEAPRRPGPIAGRTAAPAWLVPTLVLGTAAALYLLFTSAAPPAPLAVEPAPTAPYAGQGAAPAPAPTVAPPTAAPAGIGTGDGFIEPVSPAQAAPAGVGQPAPVYAPTADPFANPSDPQGEQMTAQALAAPGWHPPLVEGAAAPTPNNYVEVRP